MYHYVSSVPFDGSYSRAKFAAVKEILDSIEFKQCVIFYNSHEKADTLSKELTEKYSEWPVAFISSKIDGNKRTTAFNSFRKGKCKILVSSDLVFFVCTHFSMTSACLNRFVEELMLKMLIWSFIWTFHVQLIHIFIELAVPDDSVVKVFRLVLLPLVKNLTLFRNTSSV